MSLISNIKKGTKQTKDSLVNNHLTGDAYLKHIEKQLLDSINPKLPGVFMGLSGSNDDTLTLEFSNYDGNFITLDIALLKKLIPDLTTINIKNEHCILYVYFNYKNKDKIDGITINNISKDSGKNKPYGNMVLRIMVPDDSNPNNTFIPNFSKNCKFISNNTIDIDFISHKYPNNHSCSIYEVFESIPRLKQLKPFIELYRDHLLDKHNKYGFEDTFFEFSVNLSKFPGNIQAIKDELGIKREQFVRY